MAQGVKIDIEKVKGAISGQGIKVAEALGVHQFSLYRKLKKDDPRFSLDDLNKTCAFLGRDAADFLEFFPFSNGDQAERVNKKGLRGEGS